MTAVTSTPVARRRRLGRLGLVAGVVGLVLLAGFVGTQLRLSSPSTGGGVTIADLTELREDVSSEIGEAVTPLTNRLTAVEGEVGEAAAVAQKATETANTATSATSSLASEVAKVVGAVNQLVDKVDGLATKSDVAMVAGLADKAVSGVAELAGRVSNWFAALDERVAELERGLGAVNNRANNLSKAIDLVAAESKARDEALAGRIAALEQLALVQNPEPEEPAAVVEEPAGPSVADILGMCSQEWLQMLEKMAGGEPLEEWLAGKSTGYLQDVYSSCGDTAPVTPVKDLPPPVMVEEPPPPLPTPVVQDECRITVAVVERDGRPFHRPVVIRVSGWGGPLDKFEGTVTVPGGEHAIAVPCEFAYSTRGEICLVEANFAIKLHNPWLGAARRAVEQGSSTLNPGVRLEFRA